MIRTDEAVRPSTAICFHGRLIKVMVILGVMIAPSSLEAQELLPLPSYRKADLNCDRQLNKLDINAMVFALSDPAVYQQQFPSCNILLGDTNDDGVVDSFDIDSFRALLKSPIGDLNCDFIVTPEDQMPLALLLSDPEAYRNEYLTCSHFLADADNSGAVNGLDIEPTKLLTLRKTGDMNCNGKVSSGDVKPFKMAMTRPDRYMEKYPRCGLVLGDLNYDGAIDRSDQSLLNEKRIHGFPFGDLNCDGFVTPADIPAFATALKGTKEYRKLFPKCKRKLADLNHDRKINGRDIEPFQALVERFSY